MITASVLKGLNYSKVIEIMKQETRLSGTMWIAFYLQSTIGLIRICNKESCFSSDGATWLSRVEIMEKSAVSTAIKKVLYFRISNHHSRILLRL